MSKTPVIDYQALKAELDIVLEQLQQPDTDVDAALKAYQHGQAVVSQLESYLQTAQNQIIKLQPKKG